MLIFKQLALKDIERVRSFYEKAGEITCDYTIGGTFMWREFFHMQFCIFKQTLIIKQEYFNQTCFSMPVGENVMNALFEIREYCKFMGIQMVICTATDKDLDILQSKFEVNVVKEENWYDYLYNASDLAQMSGRRYSGQRNHINSFIRNTERYYFSSLGPSNINDVRIFFNDLKITKSSEFFLEEELRVSEVLDNFEQYHLLGIVLYANDNIAGFTIGEVIGKVLYVHIEKADRNIVGAYQMIVREFVKQNLQTGIEYVNREEDVGDEGLRTSKLSYHPCRLIEKYTVEVIDEHN